MCGIWCDYLFSAVLSALFDSISCRLLLESNLEDLLRVGSFVGLLQRESFSVHISKSASEHNVAYLPRSTASFSLPPIIGLGYSTILH